MLLPDTPDLERLLVAMGLGAARTMPVIWLIPAFGGSSVPAQVRVGLGLALSALCLPSLLGHVPADMGAVFWILLMAREVAVGLTIGFLGASIFRAVEAAGRLTDILRGSNMAEVISPVADGRTTPIGQLVLMLSIMIFLELGGAGTVATALARSYEAVPIAMTVAPAKLGSLVGLVILTSARLIESAVGLAAPALVALLLADLALGAVGRLAPQVPIYFVGMPLKALAGVGIILLALGGLQTALVRGFGGWLALLERGITFWR